MAFVLYLATTLAIAALWHRRVQPMSRMAMAVLILLPMVFCGRALLTGAVYAPVDLPYLSEPLDGYAAEVGITTTHNGTLSDLYCQIVPWRKAVRHAFAAGHWPLLNPFMLCGDILAAAAQPAPYDPLNLLSMLIPLPPSITYAAAMTFFLAGFFTFAFARALGCSEGAALVAAAGWTFSGPMAMFVGWPLARTWSLLPLVLFATRALAHQASLRSAALLTAAFVVTVLAGHPESLLHVVAVGAAYGAFEVLRTRRWLAIPLAIGAGAIALLLTAFFLFPFLHAALQTAEYVVRRDLYAASAFISDSHLSQRRLGAALLPFFGGQPWRSSFTELWDPLFARVGSVVLALALTALVTARRNAETWFFAALAVVCTFALAAAWPVAQLLHALPVFNVALNERLGFAAAFAVCILAAFAVDRFDRRTAIIAAAVVAAAIGVTAMLVWPAQLAAGVDEPLMWMTTLIELIALVLFAATRRASLLLGIILVQRALIDGSVYPTIPREAFYPPVKLFEKIDRREPFRVAPAHFAMIPATPTLYELEDVRGYQAMTFRRLADTYHLWSVPQAVSFNIVGDLWKPFLSLMNVRYAIGSTREQPPNADWVVIAEDRGSRLFENRKALPRAFLPRHIEYHRDDAAVLKALAKTTDFADVAHVLAPELNAHRITNGTGTLTTRTDGYDYTIDVQLDADAWVVISQAAWRGWRPYIDGRRVDWKYANHAFLGIFVPKDSKQIRLTFLPEAFTRGRNVTVVTLLGLGAWGFVIRRRRAS